MLSRRHFLGHSALLALSPMVPAFLDEAASAAGAQRDARVLVVIQLEGGNDGINTVVPYGDDGYGRNRTSLRIKTDELIKLNDHVGLHPALRRAATLIDQGRLAIVQGVGYPNPNRSHFESMRIWQTAQLAPTELENGWIGKAFDQLPWPRSGGPDAIYVGDGELPRSLIGHRTDAAAISSADDLALKSPLSKPIASKDSGSDDITSFVSRSVLSAYGTAKDLAGAGRASTAPQAAYPDTRLANQLRLVSQFIKTGAATRVYYAAQSSYDTHYAELPQHEQLLAELGGAMQAFMDDLKSSGLSDRVLLMAFSEFGRRVRENGSLGTDHGSAAPLLIAGDHVQAGLIGKTPDLSDLQNGDLKMSVDFRRVYATILQDWLNVPTKDVLGRPFPPLSILS